MSTLNQLQTFTFVVEKGSFSAAAEGLNMSATAMSKQVSKLELEQSLNLTLLERSTRKLIPTEIGKSIYKKCKAILENVDSLQRFSQTLQTEPHGTLHVNDEKMQMPLKYRLILCNIRLTIILNLAVETYCEGLIYIRYYRV